MRIIWLIVFWDYTITRCLVTYVPAVEIYNYAEPTVFCDRITMRSVRELAAASGMHALHTFEVNFWRFSAWKGPRARVNNSAIDDRIEFHRVAIIGLRAFISTYKRNNLIRFFSIYLYPRNDWTTVFSLPYAPAIT